MVPAQGRQHDVWCPLCALLGRFPDVAGRRDLRLLGRRRRFFEPEAAEMLNDAYLGFSVVALGLILWLVILLIKDPKGVVKASLKKAVSK